MPQSETERRLQFAVEIAREAGQFTLKHFRAPGLAVERKGDGSPVTVADKGAEMLLRQRIEAGYPQDGILSEEFGNVPGTSGFRWILDPIDGTKSFVSGVPLYTTLVAVMQENEPCLGVIFAPAVDEMVYARLGGGAWHVISAGKPLPAHVSQIGKIEEAIFLTTCVHSFTVDRNPPRPEVFNRLAESCRVSRTWGDAYGYLLVATGRAEIMIDAVMNLWDAAALKPIIEEAGGKFSDWQGKSTVHSGESVATNAALAEKVQRIILGK